MFPSTQKKLKIALCAGMLGGVLLFPNVNVEASPIQEVTVDLVSTDEEMPASVKQRVEASIIAIGNRILVGKEKDLFLLNQSQYNVVLSDIVNRVVAGYIVSGLEMEYGTTTVMHIKLSPVGQTIKKVNTIIEYRNIMPLAQELIQEDLVNITHQMSNLLIGLPVDSLGWAESVSQTAGQQIVNQALPEFDAHFKVDSGEETTVHISLVPRGEIIRTGKLTFRKTTIPRLFMYRATSKTEQTMWDLEGLPVDFVVRHREEISMYMKNMLEQDSFVKQYDLDIETLLHPGIETELLVDALTDHWIIQGEAWLDIGHEGKKNTAINGFLGHYVGTNDVVFGEIRFYPSPVTFNVFGGWQHYFGKAFYMGMKYNFSNNEIHYLVHKDFGTSWAFQYDRNFTDSIDEIGVLYKLHNYMTIEYIYNNEEGNWLRLIVNL